MELVLAGHEPRRRSAVDRHWTLIASNNAIPPLLAGVDAALLQPPVNVLRLSLHPAGLAPRIANLQNGVRICSRDCATRSTSPPIPCWSS